MEISTQKWGSGLTAPIPGSLATRFFFESDTKVDARVGNRRVIITPSVQPHGLPGESVQRYDLDELLAGITPENRQEETDWGTRVGKEVIE